jgi:hypothetical protein
MRTSGTTVYDEWTGGINGTAVNTPTFSTAVGVVGDGVGFTAGSTEYIDLGAPAAFAGLTGAGTVSAWLKGEDGGAIRAFSLGGADVASPGFFSLRWNTQATSKYELYYQSQGGTLTAILSSSDYSAGVWRHVCMVTSGTAWTMYVDGVQVSFTLASGTNNGNFVGDLTMTTPAYSIGGQRYDGVWYEGRGGVDEVRLYNVALTEGEIKQLYRMGAIPRGIK